MKHLFRRIIRLLIRFLAGLSDQQRKRLFVIGGSIIVLLLGWVILFFTKDNTPPQEGVPVGLTCRDSDGRNTKTKGAVTYTDEKGRHVDEDYCDQNDKSVYEMICRKTSFWSFDSVPVKETVTCPKGCGNGMCTK
jgi:hypothetical protein